jgi:hypothetical protein
LILLAIGICFLLGMSIGVFIPRSDRVGDYNELSLDWLSTSCPGGQPVNGSAADLLAIWKALERCEKDIRDAAAKKGVFYKLTDGLIARKYIHLRLAPCMRGILEAKGYSLADYIALEAALAEWCADCKDSSVQHFNREMELRKDLMRIATHQIPIDRERFKQSCETQQTALFEFLSKGFQNVADFDQGLFFLWFEKAPCAQRLQKMGR